MVQNLQKKGLSGIVSFWWDLKTLIFYTDIASLWSRHHQHCPHLTVTCRRTLGVFAMTPPVLFWPLSTGGVPSISWRVSALEMPRERRPRGRATLNVSHWVCQLPLLLMLPLVLCLGMLMNVCEWCQKEPKFQLPRAIVIKLCYYSHNKTTVL